MHPSLKRTLPRISRSLLLLSLVGVFVALDRGDSLQFFKASPVVIPSTSLRGGLTVGGNVMVAAGETLLSSTDDGANWHEGLGIPATDVFYTDVTYGNGLFVAVGLSRYGPYYSSSSRDGITWTTRPTSDSFHYVIPMGDGFYADNEVGRDSVASTSTDGLNWGRFGSGVGFAAYGKGQLLFGQPFSAHPAPPGIPSFINPDCTSPTCPKVGYVSGVLFLNGRFAVSTWAQKDAVSQYTRWFFSDDGSNWTYGPATALGQYYTAETYIFPGYQGNLSLNPLSVVNGMPVSLSGDIFNRAFTVYSPDFSTQMRLLIPSTPPTPNEPRSLVFGVSNYVVVTDLGSVLRSVDLTNWSIISNPAAALTGIAAHGGVVVAVGELSHGPLTNVPTARMIVSTNYGKGVASISPPSGTGPLASVRYADNKFVAVGGHGTVIRSFDGLTWSKRLSNTSSDLYDVSFGNELWVAVGANGKIVTSQDAATFYLQFSRTEVDLHSITYAGGQFIAVGADGAILKSTNGSDWAITGTDEAFDLWGIAYGNGRYVATGTNGIVHISTDSSSWSATTIPGAKLISSVNFWNGEFVATEFNTNMFYVSTDGLRWTVGAMPPGKIYGGSFSEDHVWFVGDQSSFWTTSETKLRGAFTTAGKFMLTIEAFVPGTYQIFSASNLNSQSWNFVNGFTNVQGAFAWTNTGPSDAASFYQVRRQ